MPTLWYPTGMLLLVATHSREDNFSKAQFPAKPFLKVNSRFESTDHITYVHDSSGDYAAYT